MGLLAGATAQNQGLAREKDLLRGCEYRRLPVLDREFRLASFALPDSRTRALAA
jgi:hypothetical protein